MHNQGTGEIMKCFKVSIVQFLIFIMSMLILGTRTFAQINVILPNVSGLAGTSGSGTITVGDLTGKNVTAFQFQITYDKKIIYITGVNTANTILGNNSPTVNADTANGKILVAWANATALAGSGNLLNLNITFLKGGETALNFGSPSTFMFNAGSPAATITSGSANIPQVVVQGGSVSARVGDIIKIPIMVSPITDAENVRSYDFVATFDKSIINLTNSDITGTLSDGGTVALNADNTTGTIRVAWASSNRIISTSETTLLYLTGTAVNIGTTYINFTSFEVNQGSPLSYANPALVTVRVQNFAPTLTLSPIGPGYSTSDGVQLKITLVGADQNPEDVSLLAYSITAPAIIPIGAAISGNVFTWTPTFEQRSITPYSFTFQVKDPGGLVATQTVSITVTQNYAPTLTLSPAGPNYTSTDGVALTITLNGADQNPTDVPLLAYSITSPVTLPSGAKLSGNIFTWIPIITERSVTPYSFTFMVKDQGGLTAAQTVSITVTQNYAPTLTFSPAGPDYSVKEGEALTINLVGADQNPDDVPLLQYSVSTDPSGLPAGAKLKANVFSWTPSFDQGRTSPYGFVFKVTDPFGASAFSTVSVTVVNVNRPPVFTHVPDYIVFPLNGTTVDSFQYIAVDPDGDQVSYSMLSGPAGSNVNSNGLFTWKPTEDQDGQIYTITVQATDGQLSTTTSQFIGASSTITGVAETNNIPTEYNLFQNYPNPFNPTTSIQFSIPKESFVKLSVYNVIGQEVRVLVNKNMSAGNYKINFNASELNSGVYLYRIETADYTSVRKMVLVK